MEIEDSNSNELNSTLKCKRQLTNGIILQIDNDGGFVSPSRQTLEVIVPSSNSSNNISATSRRNQNLTIDNLLGQANIFVAKGDIINAIKILHEVIRQDPRKADGYLQLAEIFENQDDIIKSFEYRLLGCLVSAKTPANEWDITGDLALTIDRLEDAAACFTKASRVDRKNWTYYEKRIKVYERLGMIGEVMKTKLLAAQYVDCERANFGFEWLQQMITETSHHFYDQDDANRMLYALRIIIQRSKQYGKEYAAQLEALINSYLESDDYHHTLQAILGFCDGIRALDDHGNPIYEVLEDYSIRPYPFTVPFVNFEISDIFATSMICRLIVCFLNIEMIPAAKSLITVLLTRPVDPSVIDLYILIAESLLHIKADEEGVAYAAKILSEEPHLAGVWFLQGCFQQNLKDLDSALISYYKTLELQDDHIDARVNISSIFQYRCDIKSALDILHDYSLDKCSHLPDERLLIQQIDIFRQQKNKKQYVCAVRMILVPYFYELLKQQESILLGPKKRKLQFSANVRRLACQSIAKSSFKAYIKRLGATTEMNQNIFQSLNAQQLFDYILRLVEALFNDKMYTEMFHVLCFAALHRYIPDVNFEGLEQLLFLSSAKSKNFELTFELVRSSIKQMTLYSKDFTRLHKTSLSLGAVVAQYQNVTIQKFLHRTSELFPDNIHFLMCAANASLMAGSYKYALSQYSCVSQKHPNDPLPILLSSICFLNMSMKRNITRSKALAIRAIALIGKYRDIREKSGPKQEIYYNFGRLLHQTGLVSQAVYWYQKVLDEPDPLVLVDDAISGDQIFVPCQKYSLKPLAALNYVNIIQKSNPGKARQLRRKYCVI
jgi:general transcription factor 3C polypeptide 3 (transcription factor C subunit 4)